ncbi:unnamed protein product [Peniophora sp. CBMAI 1063]|nr:unnamed protein product [Peniophora sp. CBMAI 1063]
MSAIPARDGRRLEDPVAPIEAPVAEETAQLQPPSASRFSQLQSSPSGLSQHLGLLSVHENPFDRLVEREGALFNDDGDQIFFTAGDQPREFPQDTALARANLHHELETMRLYDHTLFARTSSDAGGTGSRGAALDDGDETGEDSTLSNTVAALRAMGLDGGESEASDDEDGARGFAINARSETGTSVDWQPYGSKVMFLLIMACSQPRLRLSDDHIRLILSLLKDLDVSGVPSFKAFRAKQVSISKELDIQSKLHVSSLDNHFYSNEPHTLFKLDWANPLVRPHIHVYPNISSKGVSETFEAEKWVKEVPFSDLSPMWAEWKSAPQRHFFVNELASLKTGHAVIPQRWITCDGVDHVDCLVVTVGLGDKLHVAAESTIRVACSALQYNYLDLQLQRGGVPFVWDDASADWPSRMPNPLRVKADGRPMFTIRAWVWGDDVSGNRSKQYNAHTNVYIANASLTSAKLRQEYFVRFSSTSQHASCPEQFAATVEDMRSDLWHEAYDCLLRTPILYCILAHGLPADNPQQAENSSVVGSKGNKNCRYDKLGGTEVQRESTEGYHEHFSPGEPRTPAETIATIKEMYNLAFDGSTTKLKELQAETGVKDRIAEHWLAEISTLVQQQTKLRITDKRMKDPRLHSKKTSKEERAVIRAEIKAVIAQEARVWLYSQPAHSFNALPADSDQRQAIRAGDHYNQLLVVDGLNPHQDSPIEKLHTILIVSDKYIWYETTKGWNVAKDSDFAIWLASSSIDGLTLPPIRAEYMTKYKNSLIGKHFKVLQQLAIFHMTTNLCSDSLLRVWRATGELGALMWYTDIKNMDEYMSDLRQCIANLLDAWSEYDPRKIITKMKLHTVTHSPDDARRFGPFGLFETEVYECWNAIFRMCSVLSNHLAPSRDIAQDLVAMESFKHIVSGGWWYNKDAKEFIQAGRRIREHMLRSPDLQRRLGWSERTALPAGSVKLVSKKARIALETEILVTGISDCDDNIAAELYQLSLSWCPCKYAVSASGEPCFQGSWVFFTAMPAEVPLPDAEADHTMEIDGSDTDREPTRTLCGRIAHVVVPFDQQIAEDAIIVVECFHLGKDRDDRLGMPILHRSHRTLLIKPHSILFKFNAQHDCRAGDCTIATRMQRVQQERVSFNRNVRFVQHNNDDRFLLNTHTLHNASALHEILPRHLTKPVPYFDPAEREARHSEFAMQLQETGPTKRAETAAKAKATRAKKKAAAEEKRVREEHIAAREREAERRAEAGEHEHESSSDDDDDDTRSLAGDGGALSGKDDSDTSHEDTDSDY